MSTKQTARYIPLKQVINFYLSEANLTYAAYLRLWHAAFRGMEDMGMDISYAPVTRKLDLLDNKTVPLPADYVSWSKVSVLNGNGEEATLFYNKDMTLYADTDTDRLSNNTDGTESDGFPRYPFFPGAYPGYPADGWDYNLFGVGSGTQFMGEFTVDEENGLIVLGNNYRHSYIILTYLSSPEDDTDYLVPVQIREALVAWLAWRDIVNVPQSRRSNLGMIQGRRKEYYNQRRLARLRLNPLRLQDANDEIRNNSKISLKG